MKSIADAQRLVHGQLSMRARVGYAVLLTGALTMTAAIGSLWLTEPRLPARTHAAFALLTALGSAWTVFAAWVLGRRRVLFGVDRVVAASLGLAGTTLGAAGMAAAARWTPLGARAWPAAILHALLAAVALVALVRARRRVTTLRRRLEALDVRGRTAD